MSEFDISTLAPTAPAAENRVCRCGCKAPVGPRALYRPGHDARHAGQIARALVGAKDAAAAKRLLDRLPSEALQRKAITQATAAKARLATAEAEAAEADAA